MIDPERNPERAHADWPPVVVAGGFQTGVVLMRDLSRRGVRTFVVDHNPVQPCFKTVYGEAFLCPNPDFEGEAWLRFLLDLAVRIGGRPVLIPSADQYVTAISTHAERLAGHFTFLPGSMAVQAMLATKKRQYDIAADSGLPVPRTLFVQSESDIDNFSSQARFPCLMKPLHFREWERFPEGHPLLYQKVALADTPAELLQQYRLAASASPDVVVQEIIEGPDTAKFVFLACYGANGGLLGSLLLQQERTMPPSFGSASVVSPIDDAQTSHICDLFFRKVGYRGICELELKRDVRDRIVRLIEINPRYSVTADAATYAGVELGWLHYLDLIGKNPIPVIKHDRPFRHVVLLRDFACFREYRRLGKLTWGNFLNTYKPGVHFFDFDWTDWRVSLATAVQLFKIAAGPTIRRIFPRR